MRLRQDNRERVQPFRGNKQVTAASTLVGNMHFAAPAIRRPISLRIWKNGRKVAIIFFQPTEDASYPWNPRIRPRQAQGFLWRQTEPT